MLEALSVLKALASIVIITGIDLSLAEVAKKVFGIPASSAAVERLFSIVGKKF